MAIKDLKESLANNTKQLDGIRASTKSMSKGIETLVKLQTADRKQKYEEARESIRDKQKQEKLTAAKVAREKSDGTGGKGLLSGIGGLFKNLKLFDWAKWFGIIGLGILFEKEIPLESVLEIVNSRKYPSIEKTRYKIPTNDDLFWEIDFFEGNNSGLVIAEIEIPSPDYSIALPNWIGRELTGQDDVWSNQALANYPRPNQG